ncbi:MAG: hypothetical protein ACRC8P_03825 [Spiroplasma sp.]
MQNMKQKLRALTVFTFVTGAGVSTVACQNEVDTSMNSKVLTDLGLYSSDGKSQIEVKLNVQGDEVTWNADKFVNLKASKLLNAENKALSKESFNFLTDVLKLEAKGDGDWDTKTFEKAKADAISLTAVSIDPTLKAISDDYAVSKGTVKVQWKEKDNIGSQYSINLKADEAKGLIKSNLPGSGDLTLLDFDMTKGVLAKFAIGKDKSGISEKADITSNLKVEAGKGKEVANIAKKIGQSLKVTVTKVTAKEDKFAAGDSLTVKITLGSVQFSTEYQLILA